MDINMYDIMMTDKQAIEILSNIPIPTNSDYSTQEIAMALQKGINALEDRPTGRWIEEENDEMEIVGYHCSECDLPNEVKDNYCPNCGADMRGQANSAK